MFNSIRGTITAKNGDCVYLLSGGIEWELSVPALDIERLPPVGEKGRLFTWLYHREDQMKLFGFQSEKRRGTFLELLKVEGIGPKGAIKILGGIGQEDLELALENEDLARLEAVPGLGKKTAQKMILALRGKLAKVDAATATPYGELVEALAGMGYERRIASDAILRAEADIQPGLDEAEREKQLFKQAIVYLSSNA